MACAWINPEKNSAEEFEFQSEIPAPRRKKKTGLVFVFLGVNNDTIQITTGMNQ